MCCNKLKIKTFCLGILARVLACIGQQLHMALDKLNGTWYRFFIILLYRSIEVAKSDNRRIVASYLCWGSNKAICATSRNKGMTWMCETLIITLFVILMVVPLAAVMIVVEFMMRRRVLRRNRVCNSRPFNTYVLANL